MFRTYVCLGITAWKTPQKQAQQLCQYRSAQLYSAFLKSEQREMRRGAQAQSV